MIGALLGTLMVAGWSADAERADTLPWSGIVDSAYAGTAGAPSTLGVPMYRSIGDAIAKIPARSGERLVVFVRNGRYREKLTIVRPRVTLRGESRTGVVLSFDATADTRTPGVGTLGTAGSFTLRIAAPEFRAEHLTIENAFDYPTNFAKPAADSTKLRNPQAVALMLDTGSDRAVFEDVRILGHQDTLFANSGRAWFYACEVSGSVDFIFGAGQVVFEQCDIISRDRGSATNNGYITAPSTDASQRYGFVFVRSRLKKERPDMARASVTLGRPWHPSANPNANPSAMFLACTMDDHIGAKGWDRMSAVDSLGVRVWYEPESARFFEYGSTGAGAVSSATRRVLDRSDARQLSRAKVFSDWNPMPLPETVVADESEHGQHRSSGSVTRGWIVDQQDLGTRGGVGRVEEMMEGRFPGVQIYRVNGGIRVQIRGVSTINGRQFPLYVLDGYPIETDADGLISINPADIAGIEVLKDPAALAAYGWRAGSGVVLITTKRL